MITRRMFLQAIEILRTIDPDISCSSVGIFLFVSANPECTVKDVCIALGMSSAHASHQIGYLGKAYRSGKGLDLISARNSLEDRRYKILNLTTRGERLSRLLDSLDVNMPLSRNKCLEAVERGMLQDGQG